MRANVYHYNALVRRVVDGDTIILDVDLGFGVWVHEQSFRLLGINAREHSMAGGVEATSHLMGILPAGTPVRVSSVKNDKYGGRFDARIELAGGHDLASELITTGWAAPWAGTGEKPLPAWPRPASVGE